nr:hypothetical protein [Tanacetum cinerariifolium]
MNTACDHVEFQRISLTGFRSYASRSQTEASQSRQSTDCHKFDSWKNITSHLPRACLMLALAGFPSSLNETIGNRHLKDFSLSTLCSELEIPSLHPSAAWQTLIIRTDRWSLHISHYICTITFTETYMQKVMLDQIDEALDYRVKEFRINRMTPEAFEDKEDLLQPGELYLEMDEDMGPDEQAQLSDDEDIRSAHILMVNLRQGWWKPFNQEQPATPEPAWSIRSYDVSTDDIAIFMDWFYKRRGITELKPQDLEGPAFEIVKRGQPHTKAQRQQTITTGWSTWPSHNPI